MNFIEFLHSIDYFDLFSNALMITSFVVIMMSLIEYVNVWTHGRFIKGMNRNAFVQALIGTLLGVMLLVFLSFSSYSFIFSPEIIIGWNTLWLLIMLFFQCFRRY